MGLSPWTIGQTHPGWTLTWLDDADVAVDLTSATITGRIAPEGGVSAPLKNTPTSPSPGQLQYTVAANEVMTPGWYEIQFVATYPVADPLYSDPIRVLFVVPT